jgi:hypothetical protein
MDKDFLMYNTATQGAEELWFFAQIHKEHGN